MSLKFKPAPHILDLNLQQLEHTSPGTEMLPSTPHYEDLGLKNKHNAEKLHLYEKKIKGISPEVAPPIQTGCNMALGSAKPNFLRHWVLVPKHMSIMMRP